MIKRLLCFVSVIFIFLPTFCFSLNAIDGTHDSVDGGTHGGGGSSFPYPEDIPPDDIVTTTPPAFEMSWDSVHAPKPDFDTSVYPYYMATYGDSYKYEIFYFKTLPVFKVNLETNGDIAIKYSSVAGRRVTYKTVDGSVLNDANQNCYPIGFALNYLQDKPSSGCFNDGAYYICYANFKITKNINSGGDKPIDNLPDYKLIVGEGQCKCDFCGYVGTMPPDIFWTDGVKKMCNNCMSQKNGKFCCVCHKAANPLYNLSGKLYCKDCYNLQLAAGDKPSSLDKFFDKLYEIFNNLSNSLSGLSGNVTSFFAILQSFFGFLPVQFWAIIIIGLTLLVICRVLGR